MQLQLQRADARQLHGSQRPSLQRPVASNHSKHFHLVFRRLVDPAMAPASLRRADNFHPVFAEANSCSSVVPARAQHRSEHFRGSNRHLGLEHFNSGPGVFAPRRFRPLPHQYRVQPDIELDPRWRLGRQRGSLSTEGIQERASSGSYRLYSKRCWNQNYVLTHLSKFLYPNILSIFTKTGRKVFKQALSLICMS
jgi:hypothetical protein